MNFIDDEPLPMPDDVRELLFSKPEPIPNGHAHPTLPKHDFIQRLNIREGREQFPRLPDPLVEGLLRQGETMNVIAPAKVGKSWMVYSLLLSVATGRDWLGRFPCRRGRVLLIDNELMPSNIFQRIPAVADALGIPEKDYADSFHVVSLRGRLLDLDGIDSQVIKTIEREEYSLIALDAWYRVVPDESSHQGMTKAYNQVDQIASQTGAGIVLVHHSTKGDQSGKRITDVGSGAGTQSRATDCHLILREHEQEDCIVLDAALRSFAPVEPLALKWVFPLWTPSGLDPKALKQPKGKGDARLEAKDREGRQKILDTLSDEAKELSRGQLKTKTGMNPDRLNKLIRQLLDEELILHTGTRTAKNGVETDVFCIAEI